MVGDPRRRSRVRSRNTVQSQSVPRTRRLCRKPLIVRLPPFPPSSPPSSPYSPTLLTSRFHRATAPSLIKHFRDCIKNAPRELYANVLLTAGPADKDSLVVIQICYLGPKERGAEYLQAIASWGGERCLLNEVNEKSFLKQQDSIAQVLRGKGKFLTVCAADGPDRMANSGCSRTPVVPALVAHHDAAGRGDQQDRARVFEHAHRLQ